ncbi:MAG: DUF3014 domain-containing protein [Acidobacteria bacterium]|nr:DUF3014 domain-containing protein [Acidobacteriota bacterium]
MDPSEVPLDRTPPPPGADRGKSALPWLVGAVVVLVAGAAVWYLVGRRGTSEAPAAQAAAPAAEFLIPAHGSEGICVPADEIPLPRLDEVNDFASIMASTLSQHPRAVAWLATDDLVRRFVTVVDAVATGKSPAVHLSALRPSGAFRTTEKGDALLIDPRTFQRFAPVVEAVNSVDVAATVRVCSALKPRLDDAYAELKHGGTFDETLERAIVSLLQTPSLAPDTRLAPQGGSFQFEDSALEGLTPAQKHLARMGPANARAIQNKLREIAVAIGIPSERLP